MARRLSRNSCETGCRQRKYKCEECGETFTSYRVEPLPKGDRKCPECRAIARVKVAWEGIEPPCPFAHGTPEGPALCSIGEMRPCLRELKNNCDIYNEQVLGRELVTA